MRHNNIGRKFGRKGAHRRALFSNLVTSLLLHETIVTTLAKAKEVRRFVEPTITKSLHVQDIVSKPEEARTPAEKARLVHAMRMAGRWVHDREVLRKLFSEIAPKLRGRPGGYTRIVRAAPRVGDGAPMAVIELVSHGS
jgi:large subunit ribosomal protein L17